MIGKIFQAGKKLSRRATGLMILWAGLFIQSEAQAQLRIMPLGDSITEGAKSSDNAGYRSWLTDLYFPGQPGNPSDNLQCDFVGSLSTGPDSMVDKQHEGWPGQNAAFIRDNVRRFLESNPPQVVFLMIGTNDITDGVLPGTIRNTIGAILDNIYNYNSQIEIYLGEVSSRTDNKQPQVVELNNALIGLVSGKKTNGYDVTLVDMDLSADKVDPDDKIHPTDRGYQEIALSWFSALEARHSPSPVKFTDDFQRASLGTTTWAAHAAIMIQANQMVNTSAEDSFDFMAVAKTLINPRVISFEYGSNSDAIGRAFTGLAVMLDKDLPDASGYLIFFKSDQNPGLLRLYEVTNGTTGSNLIDQTESLAPPPEPGDQFQVEITRDEQGHKFTVTVNTNNGIYSSTLRDPNRVQGRGAKLYSGVMINGATNNGVDQFVATTESDLVSPGDITNVQLKASSSSALTITFTAPGDDGNIGAASSYDVRYSQAPITANNFGAAPRAAGIKTPSSAGSEETITITGLEGNTEYYVAVKAMDEVGNASKIAGGATPFKTAALAVKTDKFERTSTAGLGKDWVTGPSIRAAAGTAQNPGTSTQFAVLKTRQNVQEISMKLGPEVTIPGGRDLGILVMADTSATPTGYLIRRLSPEGGFDKIGLFLVQNGVITNQIENRNSVSQIAPQAGAVISVEYSPGLAADTYVLTVYINGEIDRIFEDVPKLENGKFAGFMLEGLVNPTENAIEEFTVAVPIKEASNLSKISGDNQIGSVEQRLENELVVKLIDADNNPVTGKPVIYTVTKGTATVETPRASDGGIRVEAESGVITGPIETRPDNEASRGSYVSYPNSASLDANVKLTFNITTAGSYRIWTRSRREETPYGVWSVRVDNGALFTYEVFQRGISQVWDWDLLTESNGTSFTTKVFNFTPGQHSIEFHAQRKETHLDKIIVTANTNFVPSGLEDPGFTTDADGFARAQVLVGSQAGEINISAKYGTLPAAVFKATASGGAAQSMAKTSGDAQTGTFGSTLSQPFTVTVQDAGGNTVANHKVSWVITGGDGKLSNYVSATDLNGKATTILTLGVLQTNNRVEARSVKQDGATSLGTIVFTATASGGQPAKMARTSGDGQTARIRTALPANVEARVTDTGGTTGVPNVPLKLTSQRGGGSLAANVSLLNPSFEANNGALPASWTGENSPANNEVSLSTTDPKAGALSLQVNASRAAEVGISQSAAYAANTNYILTFWAKVTTGSARVRWLLDNGAGGRTLDLHQSGSGNTWTKYRLIENNAQAGNRSLSFVTDGKASNFFIDDVQIVPATNSTGRLATSWTLGDTAGTQRIAISGISGGAILTGSPLVFTATAEAGAKAQLQAESGNNQVGSAGQPLPLPFVAKVADMTGVNGVANVDVTFRVTSIGTAAGKLEGNVSTKTVKTDIQGLASVTYTIGSGNNTPNTVEAAATGLNPDKVTFTATATVPGSFAIFGNSGQRATAGRPINPPLAVIVKTSDNKPIAGYPVKFEVVQGNGTINNKLAETIFTEVDGIARATLVCGTAANAVNQVRASATSNGANINGSPKTFSIRTYGLRNLRYESGDNQQGGVVGSFLAQPFVMSVVDSNNTKVPGQKVKFEVTAGGGSFEGGGASKEVTTDTSGRAPIRYLLGTQPIENRVTATITPALPGSPRVFRAVAQAAAPDSLIKVSGDSSRGVVGNLMPVPFVAKAGDRYGNGVAGIDVIFRVVSGGGSIGGQQRDTVTTQADGKAQITLTLGTSTTGGQFNNVVEARASNGSISLRNSPMRFYATATASRARAMLATTGNRQTGRAGSPLAQNFSVRVNDDKGNPVPEHAVAFRVTRGGGKFANGRSDSTVFTNATGVAALKLTLGGTVLPDSQIVTATSTDGVGPLTNSPLRFVAFARAGLPSQATSRVITSTGTALADGTTEVGVTVEVQDSFGNPVSGETVIIEVTNQPNDITQPVQQTNAQGRATGKFTSTKSGTKTVTAYIPGGIRITNGATVQFTPLNAARISPQGGNGQTGNLNTAVDVPLSVRVADRYGNGVLNHPVTFRLYSGAGKMSNGASNETVLSDGNGVARVFFIFGNTQGESQIRAEAQGLNGSPVGFFVNAVDLPARNLIYVSGNEQSGIAGETLAAPIVVKVADANGKAVFSRPVNFQVTFGNGALSASTVLTNEFGEAEATWTLGLQAGLNAVRASAEGLTGSPFDFSAQAIGGRACCVANAVPGDIVKGPVGGQSGPIQVRVVDALGNGVDGYTVDFELAQGTGVLTQTRVQTASGGFASTRLNFDNVSGYRKVRAVAGSLSGSPMTIMVYAQPAAAVSMNAVPRTNNQGGTIGKPLNFPLQVKLLDPFGNPAVGEAVNFVITSGGGALNGAGAAVTATSDSSGIAEASLTLGNSPGTNRVNAVKAGGNLIPALTFTATGFTNNFPIFVDVPDLRAIEEDRVEFTVTASDVDGDGMSFGARNLPPGAAFDSLATRTFSWKTNYNSAGMYEPEILVRDGKGGIDIEVVRITIGNRNRPPIILSRSPVGNADPVRADTTLIPGTDGVARFTMRVNARDEDPEDRLSYRWLQNGQIVGTNSNSFNFVGVLGLTYVQCFVSDGVDEVMTDWAMKVPVALSSFSASASAKAVTLHWVTNAEFNNIGFHVHRSLSAGGPYTRLTTQLIPPRLDGDYTFVDQTVEAGARYYYKLEDIDASGRSTLHGPVQALLALPENYELSQNYPNPFNPTTNIQFQMPKPGMVRLFVYNSLGQVVARLANGMREAGYHTVLWNGRDLHGNPVPSGVYHYRLEAEGYVMTKKMVLAK